MKRPIFWYVAIVLFLALFPMPANTKDDMRMFSWKGERTPNGVMLIEPMMPVKLRVAPTSAKDILPKATYKCVPVTLPLEYKEDSKDKVVQQLHLDCGNTTFVVLGIEFQ
jgi:hypothetical protein